MYPQTQHYQDLLLGFMQHVELLGYRSVSLSGVKQFFVWLEGQGVQQLDQLQQGHCKAYYAYLQQRPNRRGGVLSPHTIAGYLSEIRLLLRWQKSRGVLLINPMAGLRFAYPHLVPRPVLSREQIRALYQVCSQPQETLLLDLFYGCGLRRSEGEQLNLSDVDVQQRLLYVRKGKGRKRRIIPLTASIVQHIDQYVYEQRPAQISRQTVGSHRQALALNRIGRRMRGSSYYHLFTKLKKRTHLSELQQAGQGLHALRHTIATHLLQDGMHIERVRDFLGHDCLESTQIYVRVNIEQL